MAGVSDAWSPTRSGLLVPAGAVPSPRPTAVDLFAGAGGFSCGFHQAGWDVLAAVENYLPAVATYLTNLGGAATVVHVLDDDGTWNAQPAAEFAPGLPGRGWIAGQPDVHPVEHMYIGDVRALTGAQLLDDLGVELGAITAVIGGPPCQGFSAAGRQNVMDPRNSLVFEFARLVLEVQPKTFVMENVPAMLSMVTAQGVPVVDALARVLADGGFADYDALRRSLRFDPNARAGLRRERGSAPAEDLDPDEQLDLFDAEAS